MESSILVKAFALLEATAERHEARTLGQLAAMVGQSKPTAHRILNILSTLGYIERSGNGCYRQTGQARRLVTSSDDRRLIEVSTPVLQRIHEATRETVNLGVLRQDKIVYLQVLESPQPLRRVVQPNAVDPYYCTALGRAIVAYLPAQRQESLLRTVQRTPRTDATVTDTDEIQRILELTEKQGFAVEKDETDVGVTCFGAPIFQTGLPVAALSLSIPSARSNDANERSLIAAVCSGATEITHCLAVDSPTGCI